MALPDVEESTIHGAPSLKVRGKLLTCPGHSSVGRAEHARSSIGFDQRAELMANEPETYYVTDHCVNYPTVLSATATDSPRRVAGFAGHGTPVRDFEEQEGRIRSAETRGVPQRPLAERSGIRCCEPVRS